MIIPSNFGNFKRYKKATWFYNPFYRNIFKNWWDCFLRNYDKKSSNFSTKFLKNNQSLLKDNEIASEENSYIYMDNGSEMSHDEDSYETVKTTDFEIKNNNEEIELNEFSDNIDIKENKKENECNNCNNDYCNNSEEVIKKKRIKLKNMNAEQLEDRIINMINSFKFLERLAVDFKENYGNLSSEPIMCIFSLHCPQREKSLMHLYEKIVKVRERLRKKVQEENDNKNISI